MKKKRQIFLVSLSLISCFLNAQQKIQLPVKSSYNDVEITTSSNLVNYKSTGLDLHGGTSSAPIETYIRFQEISLPADAVIKSANLIFYGRTASSLGTTVTISGETGNSEAYPTSTAVSTSTSIRGRQYTSNSVIWQTPVCVVNKEYTTPDVTNLLLDMFPSGVGNANLSFKLTGNQKGSFIMWSYDGSVSMAPKLQITFTSAYGTYTTTVMANNDDARENTNGTMYLSDNNINLGGRSDSNTTAVRFPIVEIPEKAEISEAYIEFYSYGTSPASTVNIYTELDNAAAYATTSGNITRRSYSKNAINWITESWITTKTQYKTPNLKNIIDATRLSGWESGQAIGFKFVGTFLNNGAAVSTNETGELLKPRLVIKYKTDGNGPNVEANPLNGVSASIISTGNDDAKEYNNGNIALGDAYLYLGGRTDSNSSGFIFQNTQIPANAEIKDAYIEFYAYGTSPATSIDIYAEMTQKSPYLSYSKSITAREYTYNKINWTTEAWTTDLTKSRTPNLRNIIDEIRLNGWKSGENIAFKLNGLGLNDGAKAYAYEGSTLYRPRLIVGYINNDAGPHIVVDPAEIQTFVSIVAIGYDDGRENINGSMYLSDAYLSLAGQSDSYKTGIRFQAVELPSTAEITESYIEFYAYDKSNATTVSIKSEIGDSQIYSTVKNNISSRTYSENTELWNTDTRVDYAQNRTVDIKKLIDENRLRGWESGQSLAFLFEGKITSSNYARVRSYEAGNMYRPRLVIKYKDNKKGPDAAAVISTINNVVTDPLLMTGLVINEVSAQGSIAQKEDWIEIYNSLDNSIFINGNVSISNKDTKKDLSVLKNILIPAKGFAVLIADKKPEKGNQHLNFDLKNTGATLYLSTLISKKTTVLDELKYIETPYNTSYGRSTDAATSFASFINPTYNLSNSVGQKKLALSFSTERGLYPTGFDVTITAPTGSIVNYTLDGKFPSKTIGSKYSGPISIKQSCVLKTYAYDATGNSGVVSHTYVLQDNYKNELPNSHSQWTNKAYILTADEYSKAIAELPVVAISANAELTANWEQGSFEYLDKHIYSDRTNFFSNSTTRKYGQASISQFNGGVKFKFSKDAEAKKSKLSFL
ncbi:chitobiase/beta-hexosaminidase-like protein [Flavobacterium sp. 81]|uniref:chitobiase/beta-hexosaminidase C-terminal domain-containing protein n=1 Tax=Flavobacterium sp. 81 TaxID=2135621 RepID=UPI000EB41D08|nr:chitobiase/beta-hexosaminidase C-terminal domain-containing protein [Flavobacterium sp. 81]RKR08658.1 chitobiase/beta-hexosaminidase-like protein [Flavobacterium sp. 81]